MPPARRRLPPEDRRRAILDAAVPLIAEKGLDVPTRELAARAGVTQALLYRYFPAKAALLEAVFERVYLNRLDPAWVEALRDRAVPLEQRLRGFYEAYTSAIFTPEWMRIFMWAGLAGEALNRRYLEQVGRDYLLPLLAELAAEPGLREPVMEDLWNLHGSLVYLGIRRFIYRLPTPEDAREPIARAVARFLAGLRA